MTVTPSPDVLIDTTITDVRCLPATSAAVCGTANAADGPDYSGQLQDEIGLRITDHGLTQIGDNQGTLVDIPFPAALNCAATASTTIGGACGVNSSMNAILPGGVVAGNRMVFEIP